MDEPGQAGDQAGRLDPPDRLGILNLASGHTLLGRSAAVFGAGVALAVSNYLGARLLLAVLRDHEHAKSLIRREFLRLASLELTAILAAVACALLLPILGVATLLIFVGVVYLPQIGVEILVRAPSVAALSIDAAAAVYRAALGDELRLSRQDRCVIEQTDALIQGRHLPSGAGAGNPLALINDALVVALCTETTPSQPAFTAPIRAQVVLIAREWAQLTAQCTPALNHSEALRELRYRAIVHDAPRAFAALGGSSSASTR